MRRYDVLILGGGAAGLAAARILKQRGKRALILEARPRLGGRMWTKGGGALPLELGAEFVHGKAPVTTRLARELGLTLGEGSDQHFKRAGARWSAYHGQWDQLAKAFARIPAGEERSFAEYARDTLPARAARAALKFVASFHGADPREISALSLRQTVRDFEASGGLRRVAGGYGALVRALAPAEARLSSRVVEVRRERGRVHVRTADGASFSAPRAIVTLPLGVLQRGGVRFTPVLEEKRKALEGLAMGQALRVTFSLSEPAWKGQAPCPAFWHDPEGDFPVWWTACAEGRLAVTAWAGGPRVERLSRDGITVARNFALEQLARLSRAPRSRVERCVNSALAHDWTRDEFSLGAYSFARVKGNNSFSILSRPVGRELVFAGEATISDGENATVEGALRSGERAAENIF